ncbi:MAG: Chromosome partition protein Smc [Mycoplasmataceae bacterium]|nr:MAG: Chromosome partition protein Smc [Mycoplasmataceae bacterium]WNE40233.1 MAG: Chromosome partition protein Smc [Mycoplasmataceae bacterium]
MTKKHWKNIHSDFDYQGREWETDYKSLWEANNFTFEETQNWINSGLKPQDADFCAYLRDIRQLEVLTMLNFGNLKSLRTDYETYLTTDKDQIITNLQARLTELEANLEESKEENKKLVSSLEEFQEEIQQLNITLLHQQKISSKTSQNKMELIEDYNLLEKEHETLITENKNLVQQNQSLLQELLVCQTLLNQNQPASSWLEKHKGTLLLIGGVAVAGYLMIKE